MHRGSCEVRTTEPVTSQMAHFYINRCSGPLTIGRIEQSIWSLQKLWNG